MLVYAEAGQVQGQPGDLTGVQYRVPHQLFQQGAGRGPVSE